MFSRKNFSLLNTMYGVVLVVKKKLNMIGSDVIMFVGYKGDRLTSQIDK